MASFSRIIHFAASDVLYSPQRLDKQLHFFQWSGSFPNLSFDVWTELGSKFYNDSNNNNVGKWT